MGSNAWKTRRPRGRVDPASRFWPKVDKHGPHKKHVATRCWQWCASVNNMGYGKFGRGGKHGGWMLAHHWSWETAYGALPEGKILLHRCDNPRCVRPTHLRLGTHRDNIRDMMSKGRDRFTGDRHHSHKLSALKVKLIRVQHRLGRSQADLVRKYDLSSGYVSALVNERKRRHG